MNALWWRFWACPRTVESAALDFLYLRNPPCIRALLGARKTWKINYSIDFTRRIAATYGLGRVVRIDRQTRRDVWAVGWNRHLLASSGTPLDPEAAARRILSHVCELAALLPADN